MIESNNNIIGKRDVFEWLYRGFEVKGIGEINVIYECLPDNLELAQETIANAVDKLATGYIETSKYDMDLYEEGNIIIASDFINDDKIILMTTDGEIKTYE